MYDVSRVWWTNEVAVVARSQSFRIAYFVCTVKTLMPRGNGNVAHSGGSPLMFAVQRIWNPDMVRV